MGCTNRFKARKGGKFIAPQASSLLNSSPKPIMKNRIITLGLSVTFLSTIALPTFAQIIPTMDQPDNGFYEGPNPEWSTLHSADTRGTLEHRQYHRDAVQEHLLWHQETRFDQDTVAYENAHRILHQERNENHRLFHTAPMNP